jgi:hypothetical protein
MPVTRYTLLLPALLAGCMYGTPGPEALAPSCRATLRGASLMTVIDFPSGFRLEGQWQVLGLGPPDGLPTTKAMVVDLLLDQLSQADTAGSEAYSIPLARSLRLRAEGPSAAEALQQVTDTWCSSVLEARRRGLRFDQVVFHRPGTSI